MRDSIEPALERLDTAPAPAAMRFDDGSPFGTHAFVLPSAFNPPTIAHAHLLDAATHSSPSPAPEGSRERGPGGEGSCIALLTTKNVDKSLHGASLAHRVGMLLALRDEAPQIAVVASNQARIVDQAESLTRSFGFEQLTFVVGFDTLERLFAPRYYTDMERELGPFFEHHRVLAANRASATPEDVGNWIAANTTPFTQRIDVLEIDDFPASLSSTQVRAALTEHTDHPALSPAVRRYILEHHLYRPKPEDPQ